ncbi:MAG: hypothetical protein IPN59_15720 [Holophaga sp.]|nr:hypothetical protein [Holophaga sp.]
MKCLAALIPAVLVASPVVDGKQEFRAPNGLRVIVKEQHERSILRVCLLSAWDPTGLSTEQREHALRLRTILSHCGAGGLSRPVLERRLAERGIRVEVEGTEDSLDWTMLADSQDQEDAFELLGHLVFRPSLGDDLGPAGESVAPEVWFRASLGFPAPGLGILGLGMAERFALHRWLVRPEQSVLVIQGDLSLAQARQLVMLHLGTWSPSSANPEAGGLVPVPQSIPSLAAGAWVGSPSPGGDAQQRAAHIAMAILLEKISREETHGDLVFEAARPGGDAGPCLFGIRSGPEPERRLQVFLENLRTKGFGATDLAYVRRTWEAERRALALHPKDQMYAEARVALKGDPGRHLMALTLEEVNTALRSRLAPESLRWLVRGVSSK